MEFAWSETQRALYQSALSFASDRLGEKDLNGLGTEDAFRARWRRCAEFGLLGLSIPQTYGGMGLDAVTTARVIEAIGKGCPDTGLVFSVCAHLFACVMPILEHGTDALKRDLLPKLCDGSLIGANAITEAEAGSDVYAMKTRAVERGDDYSISGTKSFVTNGPVADLFLVYAVSDPTAGYLGISSFAVDRASAGLDAGRAFEKTGLSTSPTGALYLEEVRVSRDRLLAKPGQGAQVFRGSMLWERACLFAAFLGVMERDLETAVSYAKERRQFGKPIGKNQAIAHRIADMKVRFETARLMLYRACWQKDRGEDSLMDIAMAKLAVSEAAVQNGLDLMRIHGGIAVATESGIARSLGDAIPGTIFSGTNDIQKDLIAKGLGL